MRIAYPAAFTILASVLAAVPSVTAIPQQPAAPAMSDADRRAEIYYDLAMGHLYEQEYQSSSRTEDASRALELYKKAYEMDPSSGVIGEQLAEMYFLSQRISDAVTEAKDVIRRDPSNLTARRLLARIYVRTLGDLSNSSQQSGMLGLAVEQLREIIRLDPSDTDSALWLARLDRLNNQHDEAERVLRGVLVRDPDNESAVEQLTQLLLDENKAEEAVSLLQDLLQRSPSAGLYDELGDAYTQMHQPNEAAQAYRHAVDLDPDQASHLRGLAQSLFDLEKYQDALGEYQKLVEMEPDDAGNYLRLAEIYRQLHKLDEAEKQVLLAKERAPGNLEVIYNEAMVYEDEGHFEDAIRVLSDAVGTAKGQTQVTPSRRRTLAILYQLLGQLYRDVDNYTSAVNTFEEMSRLGPEEDRRSRLLIVDTYRAARDLPHAFAEAHKALAAYPDDRTLHINEALLYGENNQSDQAAAELRPLLDHSTTDVEIYLDLAQVYQESRRFDDAEQAIRSAEKIATQTSDREMIGFLMGGVYDREKKYDLAEQAFKGVLAIDPHNGPALNYYGYMLADRGLRLDEAQALVKSALDADPNNPAYLDSMGWTYFKQDKLAEAERFLRKAVEREGHDPTILGHLGDVFAKAGQTDLAATEWEKSLAEWHRALPAEFEADKVSELEQKISNSKHRVAQRKAPAEPEPQ